VTAIEHTKLHGSICFNQSGKKTDSGTKPVEIPEDKAALRNRAVVSVAKSVQIPAYSCGQALDPSLYSSIRPP